MNAATRIVVQGSIFRGDLKRLVFTRELVAVFVLAISVLVSAFILVFVKDVERRLFNQFEVAQQMNDRLKVEAGQLLLEQSTWATQSRIRKMAHDRLSMDVPKPEQTIVIKQ